MGEKTIFTIGFTHKSAAEFFSSLEKAGVKRVIDIRLNNVSQLAAFAKRDDLAYFLQKICGIGYTHRPDLAPTQEMLDAYKKKEIGWDEFERRFMELTEGRHIENTLDDDVLDGACLLCSEHEAASCHRRLVAEYLKNKRPDIRICHL